jgi:hypothetical protein
VSENLATVFVETGESEAAWMDGRLHYAAGGPGRLLDDFRRTVVRDLDRAGVSRSVQMALVRHKTEAINRSISDR